MAIYIIITFFIITFLYLSYIFNHYDIMSPSCIFCAMFTITAILSCYMAYDNGINSFSGLTLFVLLTGVLAFCLGDWAVKYKIKNNYSQLTRIDISILKIFLIILFDVFIVYWTQNEISRIVKSSGYTGASIMTYYRYLSSYSTYEESINGTLNQLSKICTTSAYVFGFVFVNNVIILKNKSIKDYLLLAPIVLSVYITLLSGGRSGLIGYIVSMVFIAFTLMSINNNWIHKDNAKLLFKLIIVFIVSLVAFYFTSIIVGRNNVTSEHTILNYFVKYFGESIYNFDCYITNPPSCNKYFGQETLSGIYGALRKLGLTDINYIIHLEFRTLPNGTSSGNVYTFFRRLIQDYGIVLMYVFTFIISLIYSYVYKRKIVGKPFCRKTVINMLVYSYFLRLIFMSSFDQTIFVYLSLGAIIYTIVLYVVFVFLIEIHFTGRKIVWKKMN